MSLNELVSTDYKPWLNVRANNVNIDGDLFVRSGAEGYVLGYGAGGKVSFTPQNRVVNLSADKFGLVPVQNAGPGKLDFQLGEFVETNFVIDLNDNLKCLNAGVYLVTLKFAEAAGTATARPNPYLQINGVNQNLMNVKIPLCTQQFSSNSGIQVTTIFSLNVDDELIVQLDIQPSGTINMMNSLLASYVSLVKIA